MSQYKVGTKINFKRKAAFDFIQCVVLALLVGIIFGIAITN